MVIDLRPGLFCVGLITVFCSTFQVSHTRIVPSSLLVKPVYLQQVTKQAGQQSQTNQSVQDCAAMHQASLVESAVSSLQEGELHKGQALLLTWLLKMHLHLPESKGALQEGQVLLLG